MDEQRPLRGGRGMRFRRLRVKSGLPACNWLRPRRSTRSPSIEQSSLVGGPKAPLASRTRWPRLPSISTSFGCTAALTRATSSSYWELSSPAMRGGGPNMSRPVMLVRTVACTVKLSLADNGERAHREQAAQITITLFGDAAEFVFAPARVLLWYKPDPGREVAARPENPGISNARDQSRSQRRTYPRDRVEPLARLI
jgi:hypothetical protein